MNTLKHTFFWILLLAFTVTACNDDNDDLSVVSNGEYNVGLSILGGYSRYVSIYTGANSGNESSVAFKPQKDGVVKEMEIKVSKNTLSENGKVVLRKNGSDAIVQDIGSGTTGYLVSANSVPLNPDDEINLFIDASNREQGELELTIRVVVEYP